MKAEVLSTICVPSCSIPPGASIGCSMATVGSRRNWPRPWPKRRVDSKPSLPRHEAASRFVRGPLVLRDDLLLQVARHFRVMAELFGVIAPPASEGTEHAGVLVQFLLRRGGFDHGVAVHTVGA